MTILVRDTGGTQRTITEIQVRDETNTPRDITQIWVRNSANVPKLVFFTGGTALTVSLSPGSAVGIAYGSGDPLTNAITATPAGGVPPYTYAWTTVTYSNPNPPNITTPTASATTFSQTGVVEDDTATFRCTVTDDVAQTAHEDVPAFFFNSPPFP